MKRNKNILFGSLIIMILLLCSMLSFATGTEVSTYAGSGTPGANNGTLLSSTFYFPYSTAWDKDGGLLVVDTYNNLIRKVKGNTVTLVAGVSSGKDSNGLPLGGLVDGDASKAMFDKPRFAVVDSKGNIFVSDTGNNAIRKISGGKVYTFAGSGAAGFVNASGIKAGFDSPTGIAVGPDDCLYVSDTLNNVIRKITHNGTVTTFAGKHGKDGGYKDGSTAEALFNEPAGLAFDKSGALYILDSGNQLVRKITNGVVTTYSGTRGELLDGTTYYEGGFRDGQEGSFNFPKGIDVAEDGTVFIADTWNNAIRAIKPDKEVITIAGSGTADKVDGSYRSALFNSPTDVKYRSGKLYVTDMWNNCIRVISLELGNLKNINNNSQLAEGIKFKPKSTSVQVLFDKKQILFSDTQPYEANGKIYVPLISICKVWNADIKWNGTSREVAVTKNNSKKVLKINNTSIFIKGNHTMISLNDISSRLGLSVLWVPEYKAVVISSGK